jgi:cytidyltransferase-like protein
MTILLDELIKKRDQLGRLVLVTGDFNILHPGHIRLLRFARECGDFLVVAVNSDEILHSTQYNNRIIS